MYKISGTITASPPIMRNPVPVLFIAGPDTPIQTPPDSRTAPNDNPKSGAHKNIGKYSNRAIAFSKHCGGGTGRNIWKIRCA